VQRSSHVFVGTATGLRVVECTTGREITPPPKILDIGQCAELHVTVHETLKPSGWSQKEPVTIRFGGGFFSVEDLRKQFLDKKLIYLTTQHESYFVDSYPWHLVEPLEKRAEIESFIKSAK